MTCLAPNLLEGNSIATAPNRFWLADITYVETDQGWFYLATVLDLYPRADAIARFKTRAFHPPAGWRESENSLAVTAAAIEADAC